jgi:hypothetical protein
MSDRSRMPRGLDDFGTYLTSTNAYLKEGSPTTNAVRLGLLDSDTTYWSGLLIKWNDVYPQYSDKLYSRTMDVRNQLLAMVSEAIDFDQRYSFLDRIASSQNVNVTDLGIFNIRKGVLQKSSRAVPQRPIQEPVTVTVQQLGGGSFSVKCYSSTGQRPCIYTDANCVQFAFMIGDTAPTSPKAQGMTINLSTKSTFVLSLDPENQAKNLYIYFRWFNTKHPEIAGPWCNLQTYVII